MSAKPARALASDAVVSFDAEAESGKAGIKSVRVVLPAGILPADVTLASGPAGWTLTPTEDGYTVGGTPLATKKNAVYSIKVRQLPNAASLTFKSLVNYTDGQVDRWIGEPKADNPAPVLKLAAADPAAIASASAAAASPSPSPSPVTVTSAPAPVVSTSAAAAADEGGSGVGTWLVGGIVALAAAGTLLVLLRRRDTGNGPEGQS
ncbi:hypothetical protein F4553_005561 [Allocatelliglobosispora scoriae]|uniref:YncI copper-binding domain-containing protein n=1 Tax=Allocatelliglobosispora scoriae TaxID=643052 RepID=A0A841BSS5_9ACTN|nr:YcnI family protein [Allocatelliglobosispora scoriae]MBB5872127.1 hypothetical protein [Allocatelliglobosispora scoriae]